MPLTRADLLNRLSGVQQVPTSPVRQFSTAAGAKAYGGGRAFPNMGKTSAAGMAGYKRRDAMRAALQGRNR